MKKMRLHIFIAMGVFLAVFIVGSFLDLQVSQAIFSERNGFGLTVAALSMTLGYAVIALMGGVVLYHGVKLTNVIWQRIIFIAASVVFLGVAVYFDSGEYFGPNGWYQVAPEYFGYFIAIPLMGVSMYGGYILAKRSNNPRLWLLMIIGAFFIGLSLIIGTTVVKGIFHRPRYRIAVYNKVTEFFPWWKRCSNYKELMQIISEKFELSLEASKEEFKSFPSGHTSVCAVTMLGVVLLPFIMGKELKHQVIYFYIAMAYTLFVAFTRVLVGAHYLSDVGMGGLITVVCLYIYYEIILHYPKLYEKPEEVAPQAE